MYRPYRNNFLVYENLADFLESVKKKRARKKKVNLQSRFCVYFSRGSAISSRRIRIAHFIAQPQYEIIRNVENCSRRL